MNQNSCLFFKKSYRNETKCPRKLSTRYLALNLQGMFWKISKFKHIITQVTKVKFKEENMSFQFMILGSNIFYPGTRKGKNVVTEKLGVYHSTRLK